MKKIVAALAAAALLTTFAAPGALAGKGFGRHGGYHGGHYAKYWPYRGYGYGHRYGYRPYGFYGHYSFHGDAAVVVGVLTGAVLLGALLSWPSAPYAAPYAAPALVRGPSGAPLGNCIRTTGTGTSYGRPAQFGGTMCYDRAGQAYIIGGSQRFLGYLD